MLLPRFHVAKGMVGRHKALKQLSRGPSNPNRLSSIGLGLSAIGNQYRFGDCTMHLGYCNHVDRSILLNDSYQILIPFLLL